MKKIEKDQWKQKQEERYLWKKEVGDTFHKADREQLKKAAALQYDPQMAGAPLLKAKGKGAAAEQILQLAWEHDIPIQEDPALVELLTKIDLGQQTPPELYEVVAEILALIYNLEKRAQKNG